MTQSGFYEALQAAIPSLSLSQDPLPGPTPEGHTRVQLDLSPTPNGVRVSITLGDEHPYLLDFANEEEAATSLGELFDVAG